MKDGNIVLSIRNGSFIKLLLLLTPIILFQCRPAQNELSVEAFANPGVENRPLAYWAWHNGFIDTLRMVYELEQMKEKGMQGAFIWDVGALIDPDKVIPTGPAFLGDKSLGYISLALKTAERLRLNLGLITSSSWNAGGPWIEVPDASMELLSVSHIVEGLSTERIRIGVPQSNKGKAEKYSLITSLAIPHSDTRMIDYSLGTPVSLDSYTDGGKVINWEVPEGKWEILSFFICNTMQNLVVPSPNSSGLLIDHLSKRATRNHFDTILSRLNTISTPERRIKFLEVDSYELWPTTDWTPGFIEEFTSRYGYDPVPYLPLLKGYSGNDTLIDNRFRGDYRRLVSDLIVENHFAQGSEIANSQDMLLFAEGGHGGYPRVDPLKAMGHTDVPMGEFWNRQHYWVTKEASSAANTYGKKIVASESLTGWMHWQHGPTDYKQLCDIAFCEGLNQIVFHTFAHNPEIAGKPGFAYHAGEHINVNATWWEMARPFMDYLSRCSYMLRQGNYVADVLLYYGDDAPNLVPPKRLDPNQSPDMPGLFPQWIHDDNKCTHCGRDKPVNPGNLPGYDYDYVNAEIITTALRTEKGKLVLPHGQSYRVLMIPDRNDISLEVLRSLDELVYNGAVIIGPKPQRSTSLKNYPECDVEVQALAAKIWGNCDGKTVLSNQYGKGTVYWGKTMAEVLQELKIRPDFEVRGVDNCDRRIDYVHRQTETEDIYFVSNSYETAQEFTAVFRVSGNKVPEIWNAETGLVQQAIEYHKTKEGINVELVMEPLASRFIVFRQKSSNTNDPRLPYDLQFGLHQSSSIAEPVDLTSDWEIRFDALWGGPDTFRLDRLTSWTEAENEGVKYYSGTATYNRDFTIAKNALAKGTEAYVVFEDIQEMARVSINGNDCGIVWLPPYKANITRWLKPGENTISVQVVNTWNNRIVGDLNQPDGTQYTTTNVKKSRFRTTSPLLKSGLIGKAEIVFMN